MLFLPFTSGVIQNHMSLGIIAIAIGRDAYLSPFKGVWLFQRGAYSRKYGMFISKLFFCPFIIM